MESDPKSHTLLELRGLKGKINTNPDYQRPAVWNKKQKQLLVDTILRKYDIPKMYWYRRDGKLEIVDGQQRLKAIWDFYDGKFALAPDMESINGFECKGKKYDDLPTSLQEKINKYSIDVIIIKKAIQTEYEDEVGDMFLRLQNGTTLKAQEKRNAMPGKMRDYIKDLAKHEFFKKCGFSNSRYTYDQIAAQLTCIELAGGATSIKKENLDTMYAKNKSFDSKVEKSTKNVKKILDCLLQEFPTKTRELVSHSVITLYCLASDLHESYVYDSDKGNLRDCFIKFETDRRKDEDLDREKRDREFLEYKRLTGNSTDSGTSIAKRVAFLERRFFSTYSNILPKDKNRRFSDKQRLAIFRKNEEKCQIKDRCDGKKKLDWDNWHADHIKPHKSGGKTIIDNGQVACPACNLAKSDKAPV